MAKQLDDKLGRPPVKSIESLYWVMGYIAASNGERLEDCPFSTSKNSYVYWQRGYRARIDEGRVTPVKVADKRSVPDKSR